jgi:undecaprenyl-diphosphatase
MTGSISASGADEQVLRWLVGARSDPLTTVAKGLMWLGTSPGGWLLMGVVGLAATLATRQLRTAVTAAAATGAALVSSTALKHLVGRPRPPLELALVHAAGYSMPSTAAAVVAAPTAVVALTVRVPAGARALVAAGAVLVNLVVGLALVYLGAHWATDVAAGWLLGTSLGAVLAVAARHLGSATRA